MNLMNIFVAEFLFFTPFSKNLHRFLHIRFAFLFSKYACGFKKPKMTENWKVNG